MRRKKKAPHKSWQAGEGAILNNKKSINCKNNIRCQNRQSNSRFMAKLDQKYSQTVKDRLIRAFDSGMNPAEAVDYSFRMASKKTKERLEQEFLTVVTSYWAEAITLAEHLWEERKNGIPTS